MLSSIDDRIDASGGIACQSCKKALVADDWDDGDIPNLCESCEEESALEQRPSKRSKEPRQWTIEELQPPSSKIVQLMKILARIFAMFGGEDKIIIFSRFTSFLDIIRVFLEDAGYHNIQCELFREGFSGRF